MMLPTKFQVNYLLVQKEKRKIYFQDGGHLGFPIGTTLTILTYKSLRCFLQSFKSISLSIQQMKPNIDFQDGGQAAMLDFLAEKFYSLIEITLF